MASKVVVRSLPEERFTQEIATGKHTLLADEPEALAARIVDRDPMNTCLPPLDREHPSHSACMRSGRDGRWTALR